MKRLMVVFVFVLAGMIMASGETPTLNPVCLPGYPCGSGGSVTESTVTPALDPVCFPNEPCGTGQ
jgi:hypothetical protein